MSKDGNIFIKYILNFTLNLKIIALDTRNCHQILIIIFYKFDLTLFNLYMHDSTKTTEQKLQFTHDIVITNSCKDMKKDKIPLQITAAS